MGQCCGKGAERELLVPEVSTKRATQSLSSNYATQSNNNEHSATGNPYNGRPSSNPTNTQKVTQDNTRKASTISSSVATTDSTFEHDDEKDFRTRCKALWDWNGDPSDTVQISLKAGDIIALIDKEEGGWWYGECLRTKAVGFFPGNYVEVLQRSWKIDSNRVNPKIAALQQNLTLGVDQ